MKFIDKIEEYFIITLMLALTLLVFANVGARVGGGNILWAKELSQQLFSWLIVIGAAYCVRVGANIGIDALTTKLNPKNQIIIAKASAVISSIFALILFIGGTIAFIDAFELNIELEDIPLPEWMFLSILPLGFGLLLFRCLQVSYNIFKGLAVSVGFADEAREALEPEEANKSSNGSCKDNRK